MLRYDVKSWHKIQRPHVEVYYDKQLQCLRVSGTLYTDGGLR